MSLLEQARTRFAKEITECLDQQGDPVIVLKAGALKASMQVLRDDPEFSFDVLMDVFCVDYLHWEEKALRFEVVYNLFSTVKNHRLFVKVALPEKDPAVDSVTGLWPAANWFEREVWDMFGVAFKGHPNLKRILMYEEFKGHALRKDYPYNKRQPLIGPLN